MEENHCANKLANLGLSSQNITWWDVVRRELREYFARNKPGIACFRFVNRKGFGS
jgi:hypothetical protein